MRTVRITTLAFALGALASSACATYVTEDTIKVWPSNINLGMTDDGQFFSIPIGVSGPTMLTFKGEKTQRPRFEINATDTGGTMTAKYPGADKLIVTSPTGQVASFEVTVISYPMGSVARGQEAITRIGCQKAGCHDASGPDYTPSRIGGFNDQDIQQWIINGKSLKTGVTVPDHAWPVTLEEEQGVVAYLRSLPPRGPAVMQ